MFNLSPDISSIKILRTLLLSVIFGSILIPAGCDNSFTETSNNTHTLSGMADSHFKATRRSEQIGSKSADPTFDKVFDDKQIRLLDLVLPQKRWMI